MSVLASELITGKPTHLVDMSEGWSLWQTAAVRSAGLPFSLVQRLAMPELIDMPNQSERDAAIRKACAESIDAIVCSDLLEEALTWQNQSVMTTWLSEYIAGLKSGHPQRLGNRAYKGALVAR